MKNDFIDKKDKISNHRNAQSKITLHSPTYFPYTLTDNHFANSVLTVLFFINGKNSIKSFILNRWMINAFAKACKTTIAVAISTLDSLCQNHLHSLVKRNKGLKTFFSYPVKMDKVAKKFYHPIFNIYRTHRKLFYHYVETYDVLKKSLYGIVKMSKAGKKSFMSDVKMNKECSESINRCYSVFYSSLIYYHGKCFPEYLLLII